MTEIPSVIDVQGLPSAQLARLDMAIRENIGAGVFPAASLAVYRRGEAVFRGAWGWLDSETRQRPTGTETRFDLASLTKLFTTTAILLQMEVQRVQLNIPLADVLPEFASERLRPIVGQQDPHTLAPIPADDGYRGRKVDSRSVRFQHLLTHTSGLPAWRALFAEEEAPDPREDEHEERWRRILPRVYHYSFHSPPGAGVNYSDIGMILLGAALVRLEGRSLPTVFRALIFDPLGLASLCFQPLTLGLVQFDTAPTECDARWRRRRVWGEVHDENSAALGGVAGHAGLFGTAADVARFGEAWRRNELRLNEELHRSATKHQVGAIDEGRGLGWLLKATRDSSAGDLFSRESYGHTGFTGTSLWVDPARHLVVALLTNRVYRGRHEPGIHEFRRRVHGILAQYDC